MAQDFDAAAFKETTRQQWQKAAAAWYRWTLTLQAWLDPVTQAMLDMAERESFGALQQMLAALPNVEQDAAWDEIERELRAFEGGAGFEASAELIVGAGTK